MQQHPATCRVSSKNIWRPSHPNLRCSSSFFPLQVFCLPLCLTSPLLFLLSFTYLSPLRLHAEADPWVYLLPWTQAASTCFASLLVSWRTVKLDLAIWFLYLDNLENYGLMLHSCGHRHASSLFLSWTIESVIFDPWCANRSSVNREAASSNSQLCT